MPALKERTIYLKTCDGEVMDAEKDGGWVDISETSNGGAVIKPQIEIQCFLDRIFATSLERANEFGEFDIRLGQNEEVYFFEKDGKAMKFAKVMAILFE